MESRLIQVEGVALHVGVTGQGSDLVVLTGGPGCVQYLERDEISPPAHRAWYPEPRGVGRSGGGPHTMERAIADLEGIREVVGVGSWMVMGHSWGCDLAVRYAVEHPESVTAGLADCEVPMHFIAAGNDIRPSWPIAQLAALVPRGTFSSVPGVPHDFWFTHPDVWTETVANACAAL